MRRGLPLSLLMALLCSGCVVLMDLEQGSRKFLAEPAQIPAAPDLSLDLAAYHDVAVATDPSSFPETMIATDMGRLGIPIEVGTVPLRRIAARGIQSLVELHFRRPLADERPAFNLEIVPQFLSVRQDGNTARVKISMMITCTDEGESRCRLFSENYLAERTGPWSHGFVPLALYEALNDIWTAFLRDFRQKIRPATLMPGLEKDVKMPELRDFSLGTAKRGEKDVVSGTCVVVCNDFGAFQAAAWARRKIFEHCVEHLGIEKDRIRIRYEEERTKYDEATKTWHFAFATWARTRMALQYDQVLRCGSAMVDLGLFGGTAEEAAEAAKKFIVQEMNLRAAAYAEDRQVAKADIDFLAFETDAESNLVIVKFRLVY